MRHWSATEPGDRGDIVHGDWRPAEGMATHRRSPGDLNDLGRLHGLNGDQPRPLRRHDPSGSATNKHSATAMRTRRRGTIDRRLAPKDGRRPNQRVAT